MRLTYKWALPLAFVGLAACAEPEKPLQIPYGKQLQPLKHYSGELRDLHNLSFDDGPAYFWVKYNNPLKKTVGESCGFLWLRTCKKEVSPDEFYMLKVPYRTETELEGIKKVQESGQPLLIREECALLGPVESGAPGRIPFGGDLRAVSAQKDIRGFTVITVNNPDRCLKIYPEKPYDVESRSVKTAGKISSKGRVEPRY